MWAEFFAHARTSSSRCHFKVKELKFLEYFSALSVSKSCTDYIRLQAFPEVLTEGSLRSARRSNLKAIESGVFHASAHNIDFNNKVWRFWSVIIKINIEFCPKIYQSDKNNKSDLNSQYLKNKTRNSRTTRDLNKKSKMILGWAKCYAN